MHPFKILGIDVNDIGIPESVAVTDWRIESGYLLIKLSTDEPPFVRENGWVPTIHFTPLGDELLRLRVENNRLREELKEVKEKLEDVEYQHGETSND